MSIALGILGTLGCFGLGLMWGYLLGRGARPMRPPAVPPEPPEYKPYLPPVYLVTYAPVERRTGQETLH
jgi:hypothetical protein